MYGHFKGAYASEGFRVLSFFCVMANPLLLLSLIIVIYTACYGNAVDQITFSYAVTISLNARERSLLILPPVRVN